MTKKDPRFKAVKKAVERELRARSYDEHPADDEIFEEGLIDVTNAVLKALDKL